MAASLFPVFHVHAFPSRTTVAQAMFVTWYVALGKLLNVSEPQFPHH